MTLIKEDVSAVIKKLVLGHPILKCNIEKKMLALGVMDDPKWEDENMRYWNNLWIELGFTISLQEILETIEWECKCPLRHADHDEKCFPWIAKPSPATELFEFLVSLFTH